MIEETERSPIASSPLTAIFLCEGFGSADDIVGAWISQLEQRGSPFEILIIPASGAAETPATLQASWPQVRLLARPELPGIGAALRTGLAAVSNPLFFYAPLSRQFSPLALPKLLEHI